MMGKNRPSFTAFIVDHRLRTGSDVEAENVARVLKQMKIDTQILKLDWTSITRHPGRLGNLESVARRLRFQALGKACRDLDINSLFVAHHGDDQAETVLTRLLTGYTNTGLRGIKSESRIPECHGIHEVSESGSPHRLLPTRLGSAATPLQVESGGIHIYRPLLDFRKAQLIATCEENNTEWFEDPTNADKGLTLRNTIRHVWATARMPKALSPSAMSAMAQKAEDRAGEREEIAEILFNRCAIELDVQSGTLKLALPVDLAEQLSTPGDATDSNSEAMYGMALLVRKILMLVTPKENVSLQQLESVTRSVYESILLDSENEGDSPKPINVAGLMVTRQTILNPIKTNTGTDDHPLDDIFRLFNPAAPLKQPDTKTTTQPDRQVTIFRIERERPKAQHSAAHSHTLVQSRDTRASSTDFIWSEWHLFDGRYWIRVRHRPFNLSPNHSIIVRFLENNDVEALRKRRNKADVPGLEARLKHAAPGKTRFTLPALVERYRVTSDAGVLETRERVCALPSLGWGKEGWRPWSAETQDAVGEPWVWECRYRMIDFGMGRHHSIKSPPVRSKGLK